MGWFDKEHVVSTYDLFDTKDNTKMLLIVNSKDQLKFLTENA